MGNFYNPNEYNHSDQFQDSNSSFQKFKNQETFFDQTESCFDDVFQTFMQSIAFSHDFSKLNPQFKQNNTMFENEHFVHSCDSNCDSHFDPPQDQPLLYSLLKNFKTTQFG